MRTVDLFCGAGGFTLGATAAGADVALGVDRWRPAVEASRRAGHRVICEDVADLGRWLVECPPDVDLVIGGPPCQPFSHAGAGKGGDDTRDGYPAALRALEVVQPTWAVLENVRGLLSDSHAAYWADLLGALRELFPWVGVWLLDAADYGVPQHRRRVFLVCGPRPVVAPPKTHAAPSEMLGLFSTLEPWRTMREALGLRQHERVLGGGRNASDGTRPYRWLEDEPSTTVAATRIGNAGPWVVDRPAPTICGTDGVGIGSAASRDLVESLIGRRRLTIAEAATLQGFPGDYPWPPRSVDAYRCIGNAVPPALGRAVVSAVIQEDRR